MDSRLEKVFNTCLKKLGEGIPVDQALENYPEYKEEVKELLAIAKMIENASLPRLRDEAVDSCLTRVHNAISLQKKPIWTAGLLRWQWARLFEFPSAAWAKALALVVVAFFVSWASINVSADTLPGDFFYSIKLANEKIRLILCTDDQKKAELRLMYSTVRMRELVRCLDEKGEFNPHVLTAMLDETALVTDNISRLPKERAADYYLKLERHCAYQRDVLVSLNSRVPAYQKQALNEAIQLCHHRMEWMGKVRRSEVPMGEWGPFVLNER